MPRFPHRLLSLLCALALLLPAAACADLQRGSRGTDVRQAQQMLRELGFLSGKADGVYGKKTESAVMDLQAYFGQESDGILDDALLSGLSELYAAATGKREEGAGEEGGTGSAPDYCIWDAEDMAGALYCLKHREEARVSAFLDGRLPPRKLEELLLTRLCALWEQDILSMYDEWIASDPYSTAEDEKAGFVSSLREKRKAWKSMGDEGKVEERLWLEAYGIGLCQARNSPWR